MLKKLGDNDILKNAVVKMAYAGFPTPFAGGLEYSSPARGTWNIVHTGMLVPEAHEIFVCAASCLRGVVLTAAEMNAMDRFSTVEVRENNLLEGNLEELLIDGVSDIIEKLPERPPAVLVYTSCVHHFTGCDWNVMFSALRERFPDIDFTDCYMNPTLRKSGLTPDQIMRRQLYSLLKPCTIATKSVAIIGNDLPTDTGSELYTLLTDSGLTIHEITSCKTYAEYQKMAESSLYISYYPSAKAGGDYLAKKLGGKHIYLPYSWDYDEIQTSLETLGKECEELTGETGKERIKGILAGFEQRKAECEKAFKETLEVVGDTPIAIDYTFCPRPTSVAKMLLTHGFNVQRIYLDSFTGEEKDDYEFLKGNYPELELYATVDVRSRFMATQSKKNEEKWLAVGQKAAYFLGTDYFVNVIEGGGMFGYEAVIDGLKLMREAYTEKKDMRSLVQIKGMGCGSCSLG
ncbi:MAG: nitrogenase [Lachnospiraceae bacterium]|nr:nitrogenase [Lachnospiraceae bacterium]